MSADTEPSRGADSARSSYDEVPYQSHPFSRTHPNNLATMARLFGMTPAAPNACRVLELGCASGGNLLPMAEAAPASEFVGIDLSRRQIDDGRELQDAAGLTNLRLEHLSITDVGPDFGQFDYIISHGVYSWVPPEVQEKMFTICREHLAPQGVAYISYNTFPGWHMRATVREMMNYHARQFSGPRERIEQSRALLDFLHEANQGSGGLYSQMLATEVEILRTRQDSYLFHEHLEEYNEPEYFYRFIERAGAVGLRFLGEASLGEMLPVQFDSSVAETLRRIAPDIIRMEQYHDFLRNRTFRRTLLCHDEVQLQRGLGSENLAGLYFSSALVPATETSAGSGDSEPVITFHHPEGGTVSASHPLETALLVAMHELAPHGVRFEDLPLLARTCLDGGEVREEDHEIVGDTVMNLFSAGFMEGRSAPDCFDVRPPRQPAASKIARAQAERNMAATNLLHESVPLDELRRRLVILMDGTRDRAALREELVTAVQSGDMTLHRNERSLEDAAEIREALSPVIDQAIADLGRLALLWAQDAGQAG